MSQMFGADCMSVFTVVAHWIQKGQLCFVSLFLMCECVICTLYIRAFDKGGSRHVPEPAFNVLRIEQQTEKRTSCSARLSFPAGIFVLFCETGVWLWSKLRPASRRGSERFTGSQTARRKSKSIINQFYDQ